MRRKESISRQSWVVFALLDICALISIGQGLAMLLGADWLYSIPLVVTGIGLLWYNTVPSDRVGTKSSQS